MCTHMQGQTEPLVRGRSASESWARIDPIVYVTEARRQQARALAQALGAARRGIGRGLSSLASGLRRHLLEPLGRRSERRRAIAQLRGLDNRLLADIGLRRADIELAVDGHLADPRLTRRTPAQAAVAERALVGERGAVAPATRNRNRAITPAQPHPVDDLAA